MFVVFDLDGTLANCEHRLHHIQKSPKDWRAFFADCRDDALIYHTIEVLQAMVAAGHDVEVWSGRSDEVREETESWLREFVGDVPITRMRRAGDHTDDDHLKRQMLHDSIAAGKRPDLVFDDRDRVVAMWRSEGIPCFQVAPGAF